MLIQAELIWLCDDYADAGQFTGLTTLNNKVFKYLFLGNLALMEATYFQAV